MAYPPPPAWSPEPSREPPITPHVLWYWCGGVVMGVGTLIGLVVGVYLLLGLEVTPDRDTRFDAGESFTFTVTSEETATDGWELYLRNGPSLPHDDYPVDQYCQVLTEDGSPASVLYPTSGWGGYDDETGEEWQVAATFTTSRTGEYVISCDATLDTRYGLLYDDPASVAGRAMALLLVVIGLPLLSLGAGLTAIIVTYRRRRTNRERSRRWDNPPGYGAGWS